MKTKEELSEIKEEIEKLDTKLRELTEEELEQVTGGGKRPGVAGAVALYSTLFACPGGVGPAPQISDAKLAGKQ